MALRAKFKRGDGFGGLDKCPVFISEHCSFRPC